MLKNHAFISYAVADGSEFVLRLRDDLQKSGVKTWLDKYDIKEGEIFYIAINRGLQSASAIIVVLTPASTLSVQVLGEWNDALNRHIPIIPLLLKDTQIPPVLGVLNYIDFRKDYEKGLAQLRQRLGSIEKDHQEYLRELLGGLETAQNNAEYPERFDDKIRNLRDAIANSDISADTPAEELNTNIEVGLEEERQRLLTLSTERSLTKPKKVVGTRLSSVAHFFDRVQAQKDISRLLAESSTKIVSVISFGGMGKTALASKVLSDLEQNRWPHIESSENSIPTSIDGIIYMSTRTSKITLERIFLDFAELLGGEEEKMINAIWTNTQFDASKKITQLLEILKKGSYVVLWDNLEDLMDNDGKLQDSDLQTFLDITLVNEHGMRLLVTSRISLASTNSILQYNKEIPLLEGLPEKEGVEVLRSLDPNGTIGLKNITHEKAAKIVELVKGVPRALEVVGSILANDPFMSLDDLLAQEQLFKHAEFIEALVKANYKRLDSQARYAMEALAVYARPVPLVAIEFLLQPYVQNLEIRSVLKRLTQSHSVSIDKETKTVSLHPIDRDFIYSQLPIEGEYNRKSLEIRAAEYYAQIRSPREYWTSLEALQPQLIEFEHKIKAQEYDAAAVLIDEIDYDYLDYWAFYDRLLSMHDEVIGKITDLATKGRQLGNLARIPHPMLHREKSFAYASEALEIARKVNDKSSEVEWLRLLSRGYSRLHEDNLELQYAFQALNIAQELNNKQLECQCLLTLSGAQYRQNFLEESLENNKKALLIAREIGYKRFEATALNDAGFRYSGLGQKEKALEYYKEAALLKQTHPGMSNPSIQLANIGAILLELGDFESAIDHLLRALQFSEGKDDKGGLITRRGHLAKAYIMLGNYELSLMHRKIALEIAKSRNHPIDEAIQLLHLVVLQKRLGMDEEAVQTFEEATRIANKDPLVEKERFYWKVFIDTIFILERYEEVINAVIFSQHLFQSHHVFPYHAQAIALLYCNDFSSAITIFEQSLADADIRLAKEGRLQEYKYIRALSICGLAVLSPSSEQDALILEAKKAYHNAIKNSASKGVIEEAVLLLDKLKPFEKNDSLTSVRQILTKVLP